METTNMPSRKMGFSETFCCMLHDNLDGAVSVTSQLELEHIIDFEIFKQAWEVMFKRQPMLRAIQEIRGTEYYFSFTAKFSDIPIKHIITSDNKVIEWNNFYEFKYTFSSKDS